MKIMIRRCRVAYRCKSSEIDDCVSNANTLVKNGVNTLTKYIVTMPTMCCYTKH